MVIKFNTPEFQSVPGMNSHERACTGNKRPRQRLLNVKDEPRADPDWLKKSDRHRTNKTRKDEPEK